MKNSARHSITGLFINLSLSLAIASCSTSAPLSESNQTSAEQLYTQAMELAQADGLENQGNKQTARSLLAQSASMDYMPAIHALGWMHLQGIGMEEDRAQAFQHFLRAARSGYAESQYMLGVLYAQGWGVEASSTDSLYWIKKAADQGHTEAKSMLSRLFAAPTGSDQ